MAGNQPVLDVSDLTVLRDGNPLLNSLSWQIGRGEHWALLGPNGSGKTSLLSALTGYLMPTRGEIVVMGERFGAADWRELRKQIGFVSSSLGERIPGDEPAVEIVVTGKEATINHWGRISQADHREALKILKKVNATAYADRPWATLSQGERQRILIGRALMARPNLLILDEPCAGLDPVAREHFLAFLDQRQVIALK